MSIDLASLTARLTPEEQRAVKARYRTQAKNPTTAFLLCFFLGIFGVHRFYLGDVGGGLLRLILSPLIVPGIILEIIDLLRIDAEVAHHNLGVAEGIIARVMLDHPDPHFQTQAGQLVDASLAPSAATQAAPAPAAPVAAAIPLAAAAAGGLAAAVAATHAEPWQTAAAPATPESAPAAPPLPELVEEATPAAATMVPPAPIWPLSPDYQPEPSYPAAPDLDVPPALRHESDLTPYPVAPDPAATNAGPYAAPTAEPPATPEAPTVPWGELAAGGLAATTAGGMAAALLGPHDSQPAAMPLGEPLGEPEEVAPAAAPAVAGDPTDQAGHLAEHRPLADVGEPLSEPVRVALPDGGAADAATSTLVFQHEDAPSPWPAEPAAPARNEGWLPLAGAAGAGAAALGAYELYEHHAHQEPQEPSPLAEPAAAAAALPAEPAPATEVSAAEMPATPPVPEHRTVKRVRVVRRLMVDGKVVQETAAEEVVDADADTTATAARLREALGTTDPDTLASLAHQSIEEERGE